MNKTYTPAFKARLVQELLKEAKTISQLGAEQGIHPNLLGTWKAAALQSLPSRFGGTRRVMTHRHRLPQGIRTINGAMA